MTSQKAINAPRGGRPNQWLLVYVIDLRGKGKCHFSLSVEQKADNGLLATLSVDGFVKSHQRAPRGASKSMTVGVCH